MLLNSGFFWGQWHPDAGSLARLRASVDERPHRLRRVLAKPAFRRAFLPAAAAAEEEDDDDPEGAAVAAFAGANQENALKTRPKVRIYLCVCVRVCGQK